MEITETEGQGLRREFRIVVPSAEIQQQVSRRLEELRATANLPGFRPGRVPVSLLRQRFGKSVLGEVLERTLSSTSEQALGDKGVRPAVQPRIEVKTFAEDAGLEYHLTVDVFPEIAPLDASTITLQRLKAKVSEEEVDLAVRRLADRQRRTEKIDEARASAAGDVLLVDYAGTSGGESITEGMVTDVEVDLGGEGLLPGFTDALVGKRAGDRVEVATTLPADFMRSELAGKPAQFAVSIKELRRRVTVKADDALAQSMGLPTLADLRATAQAGLVAEFAGLSRAIIKRQLLDRLAQQYTFEVPTSMLDAEFQGIWTQIEQAIKDGTLDEDDKGKAAEQLKDDYRAIALRRVRLGLLLREIGRVRNVEVTRQEINDAVMAQARQLPGQEQLVLGYYQRNPEALTRVHAPLFEDKVIDDIVETANVTEREVASQELIDAANEQAGVKPGAESVEKPKRTRKAAAAKAPAAPKAARKKASD